MKQTVTLAGILLAFALSLASCGGNNQSQQASDLDKREAELQKREAELQKREDSLRIVERQQEEQRKQSKSSAIKTFKTNKGNIPYEKAYDYCYQLGYKHGILSRNNSMPTYIRENDMKNFESLWTGLYGIPTSTEESRKAYEACFENYKKGYDESFFKK